MNFPGSLDASRDMKPFLMSKDRYFNSAILIFQKNPFFLFQLYFLRITVTLFF